MNLSETRGERFVWGGFFPRSVFILRGVGGRRRETRDKSREIEFERRIHVSRAFKLERERERTGPAYICLTKILRASVQRSLRRVFSNSGSIYTYVYTEIASIQSGACDGRKSTRDERLLTQVLRKMRRIVGRRWYARSFLCGHWNAKLRRNVLDIQMDVPRVSKLPHFLAKTLLRADPFIKLSHLKSIVVTANWTALPISVSLYFTDNWTWKDTCIGHTQESV